VCHGLLEKRLLLAVYAFPSEPKLFFRPIGSKYGIYICIYTNIGGILMGSMLPYIAAPWILWVGVFHSLDFSGEIRRVDAPTCAETGEICAICLAELAAQNEEARESGPTEPRFP